MVAYTRLYQWDDGRLLFLIPFQPATPFSDAAEAEASRQVKGETSHQAQGEKAQGSGLLGRMEVGQAVVSPGNDQNWVSGESWAGEDGCSHLSPRQWSLALSRQRASFAAESEGTDLPGSLEPLPPAST